MLLRETLWEIFSSTGNIDAYLAYRACSEYPNNCQRQLEDEATEIVGVPNYFSKHILCEVKWH
ncbi:MAG: hypothetical protein H6Q72_4029 [Firmicutes bacterium]|nr:hypothetical protein [Bacillota bacterium]